MKTYIAAMGGTLLARATDDRVDCLTHKKGQRPRSYQLRKCVEFLSKSNNNRYHMGATGKSSLNNSPFYGSNEPIDQFSRISPTARPAYEHFRDCMIELNLLSKDDALAALAAFLQVRVAHAKQLSDQKRQLLKATEVLGLPDLIKAVKVFVEEDPEGGKRGQAFAAAILDCVFEDVELQKINSPHPIDVRMRTDGQITLAVEVKQAPTTTSIAFDLAREAGSVGAEAGLLIVLSR